MANSAVETALGRFSNPGRPRVPFFDRFQVLQTWAVRSQRAPGGVRVCARLRDWGAHLKAREDKYWLKPLGQMTPMQRRMAIAARRAKGLIK